MARVDDVDEDDDAFGLSLSVFCFLAAGADALLPVMRRLIRSAIGKSSSLSDASATGLFAILGGAAADVDEDEEEEEDEEEDDDEDDAAALLAGAGAAGLLAPLGSAFTLTSLFVVAANLAATRALRGISSSSSESAIAYSIEERQRVKKRRGRGGAVRRCTHNRCTEPLHFWTVFQEFWVLARTTSTKKRSMCGEKRGQQMIQKT